VSARRSSVATLLIACVALLAGGCGGSGETSEDIVFVSTQDGDYALFGTDRDGGDRTRLTDEKGDPSTPSGLLFQVDPAWSPDGRRVAFASAREGSLDIYVMDVDGTGTQRLTSTKEDDGHPTWSPDGERIAFHRGDGHLYVMKADGSGARRVTSTLAPESEPAWSPDGRWLAYTQRTPGTPIREVWVVSPDGGGARRVTKLAAESYTPAWAPDGRTIAFASNHEGPRYGIFTIGVDGEGLRQVTPASSSDAFEPAWSPDGSLIAFSRDGSIVTIDSNRSETVLTDPENNDSSPAWNPAPEIGEEGS
jgi:Tol biopolymer transport system component